MTDSEIPRDTAPLSEWVEYGERRVGHGFAKQLSGYFRLAREVVDAGGPLVERVAEHPGETKALHVGALLLARILSELTACVRLLELGYAAQAITLAGTMLELTHVLAYIGDDEVRAKEWLAWDKPNKAYPGPIERTIKQTATKFGASEQIAKREYEVLYRQICQMKHGNTRVLHLPNTAVIDAVHFTIVGPVLSPEASRLGHAAMHWAIRYGVLAETVFIADHLPASERVSLLAEQARLAGEHRRLAEESMALLAAAQSRNEA